MEFLEAQHEEIESLDMTDWMRDLHINERLVVFAYFRNCKKLKTLKIHFKDIDGRSSLVHPCEGGLKYYLYITYIISKCVYRFTPIYIDFFKDFPSPLYYARQQR